LRTVPYDYEIHVAGTGVSAFHTDTVKFDPLTWKEYKMADIMASLELAKKGTRVICLAHKEYWLKMTESSKNQSIFISERRNSKRQDELANVIYELVSRNK
jgi:hypothetical protein